MPRIKRGLERSQRPHHPELVNELVKELRSGRELGQPRIEEQHFPTNLVKVTVTWDKWDHIRDEHRSEIILDAYEQVEGRDFRDRITLAIGLTVPEAFYAGMLPYQVLPHVRATDPVTEDECRKAMLAKGATQLFDPQKPTLLFGTEEEAAACIKRIVSELPASAPVWTVSRQLDRAEA